MPTAIERIEAVATSKRMPAQAMTSKVNATDMTSGKNDECAAHGRSEHERRDHEDGEEDRADAEHLPVRHAFAEGERHRPDAARDLDRDAGRQHEPRGLAPRAREHAGDARRVVAAK